jgi:Arabinose-binding domain of AraC transcription regulator, N-term/Helix-turn-helix domain
MARVEATLTARAFLPLLSGLRRLGHDPAPLLAAVGLDAAALEDPDARIPMSAGAGLLVSAAAFTGDDCIGLHLAEHADLRTVDVHFYAMAASDTLRDAFVRLSRYQRLIHDTSRIELSETTGEMTLRHALPGGFAAPRQSAEFLLAAWVRTLVTGTDWRPVEVRFAHAAPASVEEHRRFFQAPMRFSAGENPLTVSEATLSLPCAGADPALASLMDRYAGEHMRRQASDDQSLSDRLRDVLIAELRDGEPSAARVATRLMAVRHLANPRTSIGEVAFLLGFSELSAFYRAFRRWTGQTPAQFRDRGPR